jgi:hypothetical protein
LTLLPLLAVLLVPATGRPVRAGPPEGVSGAMALDEVADGLRKYRREKDRARRAALLTRLAATRDPRVALVLGEALDRAAGARDFDNLEVPIILLATHYVPKKAALAGSISPIDGHDVVKWWKANEADLRRRAKLLPQ